MAEYKDLLRNSNLKPIETCPNGHRYNATKYGLICPVCGNERSIDDIMTDDEIILVLTLQEHQWACGILVGTRGINKGRVFVIKRDRNSVGSSPMADIYIRGDKKIAKDNHIQMAYDMKTKNMILIPGASRHLVYVNEKAVYEPTILQPFDSIEMGEGQYTYINICGEEFSWGYTY